MPRLTGLLLILLTRLTVLNAQDLVSVNLNIDGRDFGIKFPSSLSAAAVAEQFCVEQAQTLGVVRETLASCVLPVEKFLLSAISDEVRKRVVLSLNDGSVQIKMKVNDVEYDISFPPSSVTIEAVANAFCTEKAEELGITAESFASCYSQVSSYVLAQLKLYADTQVPQSPEPIEATVTVPMRVGDRDYTLQFTPQRTSPAQVATQFCIEQGSSLGFNNDNVNTCIEPIAQYLAGAIQNKGQTASVNQKAAASTEKNPLEVTLTVAGVEYGLSFDPFVVSSRAVAEEFCSSKGAELGVTNANFVSSCVEPVTRVVEEAVRKNVRA